MAEICSRENNNDPIVLSSSSCDDESISSRAARRRRMEIRRFKFITGGALITTSSNNDDHHIEKRQKIEIPINRRDSTHTLNDNKNNERVRDMVCHHEEQDNEYSQYSSSNEDVSTLLHKSRLALPESVGPKFGIASVCGRRRDMEDAVAIHPSFLQSETNVASDSSHFYGVYDGHGCSHVAMKCKERLHKIVKEELGGVQGWKPALERSFNRMDKEAIASIKGAIGTCRCELQSPKCDAVGSTAVVAIVTPENIIVANCGDSRAVLCRNGKPIPLSTDHKVR